MWEHELIILLSFFEGKERQLRGESRMEVRHTCSKSEDREGVGKGSPETNG